jgi:excisionase family DNA binding protein
VTALLTTSQAAAILGVGRHEVQRLCRLGLLPAQRIGRDWLVTEAAARDYHRLPRGRQRGTG